MDSLPLNILDLVVLAVLGVSGVLAFVRGFVHEVLAVSAWVGAVFATIHGMPILQPMARKQIESTLIADIAAGAVIFLVSLLVLAIFTKAASRRVRESALNSVDSSLGFVFGLIRGAVIVSLAYMLGQWVMGPDDAPDWLASAKARPWMERGAGMIRGIVPEEVGLAENTAKAASEGARDVIELEQTYRKLAAPEPRQSVPAQADGTQAAPASGYGTGERRDMDRLFQNNQ